MFVRNKPDARQVKNHKKSNEFFFKTFSTKFFSFCLEVESRRLILKTTPETLFSIVAIYLSCRISFEQCNNECKFCNFLRFQCLAIWWYSLRVFLNHFFVFSSQNQTRRWFFFILLYFTAAKCISSLEASRHEQVAIQMTQRREEKHMQFKKHQKIPQFLVSSDVIFSTYSYTYL
jgi:hypothetical protein